MIQHFSAFHVEHFKPRTVTEKQRTADNIITFDIESTSVFYGADNRAEMYDYSKPADYYKGLKKAALCYIWQISIDGVAYFGRELSEFAEFIESLRTAAGCDILVWVHNLPFEFQFIRRLFSWQTINARDSRKQTEFKPPAG